MENIRGKLDKIDLYYHERDEQIEGRLTKIERENIPRLEEKVKFIGEVQHINTNRIEKVEYTVDKLNKMLANWKQSNTDLDLITKLEERI